MPKHVNMVKEEVEKLKKASAITKVLYPSWLSNTVVVKKKTSKWRVCVDFTSFNQSCPKDCFPLPKIDQLVDSTSSQALHDNLRKLSQIRAQTKRELMQSSDTSSLMS